MAQLYLYMRRPVLAWVAEEAVVAAVAAAEDAAEVAEDAAEDALHHRKYSIVLFLTQ